MTNPGHRPIAWHAHHEAGHVVMAFLTGRLVTRASIEADYTDELSIFGKTSYLNPPGEPAEDTREAVLQMSLAGEMAICRMRPGTKLPMKRYLKLLGEGQDYKETADLTAKELCETANFIWAFFARPAVWRQVSQIATRLLQKCVLTDELPPTRTRVLECCGAEYDAACDAVPPAEETPSGLMDAETWLAFNTYTDAREKMGERILRKMRQLATEPLKAGARQ